MTVTVSRHTHLRRRADEDDKAGVGGVAGRRVLVQDEEAATRRREKTLVVGATRADEPADHGFLPQAGGQPGSGQGSGEASQGLS